MEKFKHKINIDFTLPSYIFMMQLKKKNLEEKKKSLKTNKKDILQLKEISLAYYSPRFSLVVIKLYCWHSFFLEILKRSLYIFVRQIIDAIYLKIKYKLMANSIIYKFFFISLKKIKDYFFLLSINSILHNINNNRIVVICLLFFNNKNFYIH